MYNKMKEMKVKVKEVNQEVNKKMKEVKKVKFGVKWEGNKTFSLPIFTSKL